MWRDRTNLFVVFLPPLDSTRRRANLQLTLLKHRSYISYRQSYSHRPAKRSRFSDGRSAFANGHGSNGGDDDDRRGLLSAVDTHDDDDSGSDVVVEMDRLPPRWADVSDEVTELLAGIARKSAQLEQLHGKHVLPGFFDDRGDRLRAQEEGQIERLTVDITADFHACQDRIRRIGTLLQSDACASSAHRAMGHNLQVSLATRVQDSSTRFRKKQSAYLKSLSPFRFACPPSSSFILLSSPPRPPQPSFVTLRLPLSYFILLCPSFFPWARANDRNRAAGPVGVDVAADGVQCWRGRGPVGRRVAVAVGTAAERDANVQRRRHHAARTRDHRHRQRHH